jgi:hypothetical protein
MANVDQISGAEKSFTLKHPIEAVGLKYGAIGSVAMIAYFLIMRMFGLVQHPELRFINYLILACILYLALREERRLEGQKRLEYLPGIGTGLLTSTLSAMGFSIFVFIYTKIDPSFLSSVASANAFPTYINAYTVGLLIFAETLILGGIASFILMQLFKRNKVRPNA